MNKLLLLFLSTFLTTSIVGQSSIYIGGTVNADDKVTRIGPNIGYEYSFNEKLSIFLLAKYSSADAGEWEPDLEPENTEGTIDYLNLGLAIKYYTGIDNSGLFLRGGPNVINKNDDYVYDGDRGSFSIDDNNTYLGVSADVGYKLMMNNFIVEPSAGYLLSGDPHPVFNFQIGYQF